MDLRTKWDRIYAEGGHDPGAPSIMLTDNSHLLPARGLALDLACGLGQNALWLATRGLTVDCWDISAIALSAVEKLAADLPIKVRQIDITPEVLPVALYDIVVVSRYLERELCPAITSSLRPGGILFYQTFVSEKVEDAGPGNPAYLLEINELLALFRGLRVLAFRDEGRVGDSDAGLRNESYLIAQKQTDN